MEGENKFYQLTTINLITIVPAVIFSIAFIIFGNTFGIATGKFSVIALAVVIFAIFGFVTAIPTIVIMIAFPKSIDASAVVTSELVNRAFLKGHSAILNLGLVLISTINTI